MTPFVTAIQRGSISEITFGTEKSNALPIDILEQLAQTIHSEAQKADVKVILLKSFGERTFCAGASFDELLLIQDIETSRRFFGGFAKVLEAMRTCGKIIVGRVQGKVTGGGVGIACATDYCFATQEASLALTELNLGIGPFVISPFVERKIGKSQLSAMALDTQFRSASWAKQHHIYHHISNSIAEMDTEIEAFLQHLATKSTDALQFIKNIAWEGTEHFAQLLPERIEMSASLILKEEAKKNIEKIKEKLREKKK